MPRLLIILVAAAGGASLRKAATNTSHLSQTISPNPGNCVADPSICLLNESCKYDIRKIEPDSRGVCVPIPTNQTDCYREPNTCRDDQWCELQDHTSWQEIDHGTRGQCVSYQGLCMACTRTAADGFGAMHKYPGLTLWDFNEGKNPAGVPGAEIDTAGQPNQYGQYIERALVCDYDNAVCTGDVIPALPPTCVEKRAPFLAKPVTADTLLGWIQRMLRMGARTYGPEDPQPDRGVSASYQLAQGASRNEVHNGINDLLQALWPTQAVNRTWPGPIKPLDTIGGEDLKCCHWANYSASLSGFQKARGKALFRNPGRPRTADQANPPPCVWCEFDGAFNDENPTIWSIIHALTFNLPDRISSEQYSALRALPLWLREHLSCSLCRSHIQEHLIELGIPTSREGDVWAWYFWRAHNYVNEQSEVTRCGSQGCNWGAFENPAPEWECPGLYRYPWFVTFEDAVAQWKVDYKPMDDDAVADGGDGDGDGDGDATGTDTGAGAGTGTGAGAGASRGGPHIYTPMLHKADADLHRPGHYWRPRQQQ